MSHSVYKPRTKDPPRCVHRDHTIPNSLMTLWTSMTRKHQHPLSKEQHKKKDPHPTINNLHPPPLQHHQLPRHLLALCLAHLPHYRRIQPWPLPQCFHQEPTHIPRSHERWKELQRLHGVQARVMPRYEPEGRREQVRGRRSRGGGTQVESEECQKDVVRFRIGLIDALAVPTTPMSRLLSDPNDKKTKVIFAYSSAFR